MIKRYESGDVLYFKGIETIRRDIISVRETGYDYLAPWSEEIQKSEDTHDPFFEDGWTQISKYRKES